MIDLGWHNNPVTRPQIEVQEALCRAAGHRPKEQDIGPFRRGLDHVVVCELCEYKYHYDSSD